MRAVLRRWLDGIETRHGRLKGIERRNALPPNPNRAGAMTTRKATP